MFSSCNQAERASQEVSEQEGKSVTFNDMIKGKCVSGDCENGYGTFRNFQGTYVGEFKDAKFHGQGTFTYSSVIEKSKMMYGKDGMSFDESLKKLGYKFNTEGLSDHKSASSEERIEEQSGTWKGGELNGYGSRTWTKAHDKTHQQKYVGNFKDGKIDGYGTKWYNWGDYFKGTFYCCSGDNPTQEGTMFFLDGTSEYGTWETVTRKITIE
jgi:hypothetical protein